MYLTFQTYVNEEKTRTFISMNVHPSPQLYELVDASDRALAEYELPTYYEVFLQELLMINIAIDNHLLRLL